MRHRTGRYDDAGRAVSDDLIHEYGPYGGHAGVCYGVNGHLFGYRFPHYEATATCRDPECGWEQRVLHRRYPPNCCGWCNGPLDIN